MIPDRSRLVNFTQNPLNLIGVIGIVLTAPILATFATRGYFVRYVADDFCTAASVVYLGWWGAQFHWYYSWSGRFGFTAIITALESLGMWVAQILPALTILGWLAALSWVLGLLMKQAHIKPSYLLNIFISMLIVSTYVITSPHSDQIFYWFTGNVTYTLPLIFLTVAIGLGVKSFAVQGQPKGFKNYILSKQFKFTAVAGSLFFIAASLNETYAVFQLAVLGLAMIFVALKQLQTSTFGISNVAAVGFWLYMSIISTLIMYLSPGNTVRNTSFPDNPTVPQTIEYAFNATNSYLINDWQYALFGYTFIISACLFALCMKKVNRGKPELDFVAILNQCVTLIVLAYLLCVLVQMPSYYVQHYPTSARSLASIPFTLSIASILLGYQAARILVGLQMLRERILRPMLYVITLIIMMQVFTSQTVYLWNNLKGELPDLQSYAAKWDAQSTTLFDRGKNQASTAEVSQLGMTFELEDTSPDGSHWINKCMADFYSIGVIWAENAREKL